MLIDLASGCQIADLEHSIDVLHLIHRYCHHRLAYEDSASLAQLALDCQQTILDLTPWTQPSHGSLRLGAQLSSRSMYMRVSARFKQRAEKLDSPDN